MSGKRGAFLSRQVDIVYKRDIFITSPLKRDCRIVGIPVANKLHDNGILSTERGHGGALICGWLLLGVDKLFKYSIKSKISNTTRLDFLNNFDNLATIGDHLIGSLETAFQCIH